MGKGFLRSCTYETGCLARMLCLKLLRRLFCFLSCGSPIFLRMDRLEHHANFFDFSFGYGTAHVPVKMDHAALP